MMSKEKILIIDDESMVRWPLSRKLAQEGYTVLEAENGRDGITIVGEESVDMVLLDLKLPDMSGVEILRALKEMEPDLAVVIMTGFGSIETAVDAMKLGAYDYLRKPFDLEELLQIIEKALEVRNLRLEVHTLRMQTGGKMNLDHVVGKSVHMQKVVSLARMVAASETANVMLLGESGTGKNLLAEVIHNLSPRHNYPLVVVTCTAMPAPLIESELFGHERGAFTDAKNVKKGLCEVANGGTLFLDEIGDMPLELQAKLLGFIESHSFRRIGGTRDIKVNLRIVAATNKDLKREIQAGRFREDLYYRLNVFQIDLPPLRSRPEDIPDMAAFFLERFSRKLNRPLRQIHPSVIEAMRRYPWPGNIREFQNMIERSLILADGGELSLADFPRELTMDKPDFDADSFVLPPEGINFEEMERSLVRQALEKSDWNQTRAARLLGFSRDQMRYRVKQFGFA